MKTRSIAPLLTGGGMVLLVTLACSMSIAPPLQPKPTETPLPSPTPVPSNTPTPLPSNTPTPVPPPPDFFTEQFSEENGLWTWWVIGPNADQYEDTVTVSWDSDVLRVEIPQTQLYVYFFYEPYTYTDVRLTMEATNRGANTNNVSLVCRYDAENRNWYEFSVGSGGDWYLFAHTDDGYHLLNSGGARTLKMGHATNQYGMDCIGNKISLFVNGQELIGSPFTDKRYGFAEGQVGLNISSLDILNVAVDVEWLDIAQP